LFERTVREKFEIVDPKVRRKDGAGRYDGEREEKRQKRGSEFGHSHLLLASGSALHS
jgi:hypothetical protein